ncbi:uncharacterized protein LOC34620659 [Cyclospora cayetanensis]|uniref:Uncharacterized protein LOC34620659 n=1 Tax=Cyclospora cayetanensis TaxID=88456 RepID=A0A6P6RZD9_9EIME|nr:uncharacterized protein LOC34620659 [Cyclospora cayetanensis]
MEFANSLFQVLFPASRYVDSRGAAESPEQQHQQREQKLQPSAENESGAISSSLARSEAVSPTQETDELPVGEAIPEGEHIRTLRIYSLTSDSVAPSLGEQGKSPQRPPVSSVSGAAEGLREVHVLRVFRNPDVLIAPSLLTQPQCRHLLHLAEGKWERSKTSIGLTTTPQTQYRTLKSKTRTSRSVILQPSQTPIVHSVELLACALARLPLQHLEGLVLVRYDEGEYFNEHHDGNFRPKTVLLYLNDVDEGGFTHFTRLGLKISPAEGTGAVWDNITPNGAMDLRTLHAGASPTRGTKFVVNCFFNETVVRPAAPPLPLSPQRPSLAVPVARTCGNATARSTPAETLATVQVEGAERPPTCSRMQLPTGSRVWEGHTGFHPIPRNAQHILYTPCEVAGLPMPVSARGPATWDPSGVSLKYMSHPLGGGPPAPFGCPSSAWRMHGGVALPPGRRWLPNWPAKGS